MRNRLATVAVAALALSLAACGGAEDAEAPAADETAAAPDASGAPAEPEEPAAEAAELVYVGAAAVPGSTQIGVWAVADHLGFFEDENIEVAQELADGSTAAIQIVASGSADFTNAGVVSIMAAVDTGVPVKGFAGVVQNYPWRMAVLEGSDITEPADLEGKTIGIISLASESNAFSRAFLEENGIDPAGASFVPVGAGAPALSALQGGQVDALALYTEMYASMENQGASFEYLENPELFDQMPSIALATTNEALEQDADVLGRVGRAIYKGLLFAWANPEAAMRIGYEYYPEKLPESGDPEENLEADTRAFQAWIDSVMPLEGEPADWDDFGLIDEDILADVQAFALSAGQLQQEVAIEDVWTNDLIDEINDFDRQEVLDLAEAWTPESLG